jgi:hypothetical protein
MGLFGQNDHISKENALIGELQDNGDIVWNDADFELAWSMYKAGVLENRGSRTVNGIHYMLFYLPPPAHNYQEGE